MLTPILYRCTRVGFFETAPVRTYCYVEVTGSDEVQYAVDVCELFSMTLLHFNNTPTDRLCALMRVFGINEQSLSVAEP